jgi:hypothetical protein
VEGSLQRGQREEVGEDDDKNEAKGVYANSLECFCTMWFEVVGD